jgi:hypothetical protein
LISYDVKTVIHGNWKYHNTLCIRLNKNVPHFLKVNNLDNIESRVTDITNQIFPEVAAVVPIISVANSNVDRNKGFSDLENDQKPKKIWPVLHKKVGLLILEDKTSIKTNIKIDLIDLKESIFFKKTKTYFNSIFPCLKDKIG